MINSRAEHEIQTLQSVNTIADGIAVKTPGQTTFNLCEKYVDEIVTVTDDEISTAILTLIEKQKLVAEGAGAVSVAAALFNKVPIEGKKVVCLISGGNIDVTILSRVIDRGLQKAGRLVTLNIKLIDKPGQLRDVSKIIADLGGNVVSVNHDRTDANVDINSCFLRISLETRDRDHVMEIKNELMKEGYSFSIN